MKQRLAVLLVLAVALVGAAPPGPATAGRDDGIDWGVANWAAGVQMYTSEPSATDRHVHVRFKRVGGQGQRQVRLAERHWLKSQKRWSRWTRHGPTKLAVGGKVVYTTDASLPCEPRKQPLGVRLDMRIKPPGMAWKAWTTWVASDWYLLDCSQDAVATPRSAPARR